MKRCLIYLSCFLLFFSCKAEGKDNIKEKKNVVSEDSITIRQNPIQENLKKSNNNRRFLYST